MKTNILNTEMKKITLCPDDISDELYSSLNDAFYEVLKDHGIDTSGIYWDEWHLIATYKEQSDEKVEL